MMKFDITAVYFAPQNTQKPLGYVVECLQEFTQAAIRGSGRKTAIEIGRDDKNGRARPHVMAAYLASHEKYASLYEKLAE
jgi:hypothetical protein